jgi:hypothetical protein
MRANPETGTMRANPENEKALGADGAMLFFKLGL